MSWWASVNYVMHKMGRGRVEQPFFIRHQFTVIFPHQRGGGQESIKTTLRNLWTNPLKRFHCNYRGSSSRCWFSKISFWALKKNWTKKILFHQTTLTANLKNDFIIRFQNYEWLEASEQISADFVEKEFFFERHLNKLIYRHVNPCEHF